MDDSPHQGLGAKHLSIRSAHWSTRLRYTAPQKACAQMCYRREREGDRLSEPALLGSVSLAGLTCRAGRGEGGALTAPVPREDGAGSAHRRAVAGRREPLCTHG
jgi:hypothetical protein